MKKSKKIKALIKGAKMGKASAQYALGLAYEEGKSLPQSTERAIAWIGEAAAQGHEGAKAWLAEYYFDDDAFTQANA